LVVNTGCTYNIAMHVSTSERTKDPATKPNLDSSFSKKVEMVLSIFSITQKTFDAYAPPIFRMVAYSAAVTGETERRLIFTSAMSFSFFSALISERLTGFFNVFKH